MPGTLYLSTALEPLAQRLKTSLKLESSPPADPFTPSTVIVPSSDIKTWLQLYLADELGIAINIQMQYLENAMWTILNELTGLQIDARQGRLEHESYRLLVLAILLNDEDTPDFAPIRRFTRGGKDGVSNDLANRDYCRRVWDIADRVARLIRDYEYHRQKEFIHQWIADELVFAKDSQAAALERCERAIFTRIIDQDDGVRLRLSRIFKKTFKTLPQFAQEAIEGELKAKVKWPDITKRRPIHLFGVSQISPYHIRLLRWLAAKFDIRVYHINPILSRLPSDGGDFARLKQTSASVLPPSSAPDSLFSTQPSPAQQSADSMLRAWARAGSASLTRMSELVNPSPGWRRSRSAAKAEPPFAMSFEADAARPDDTVLHRLQNSLFAPEAATGSRIPQDCSVQVVPCPGIFREVETVYQSIFHNLQTDSELKQNEIAVFVTDMNQYRPVIQSIFDRDFETAAGRSYPPISYSLTERPASEFSAYGQALLAMFDAALEGFPRSRVLDVLSNPCVLARLNADPAHASIWLEWTNRLAVFHGWDQRDNAESGYANSPLYSWRRALQRLRLGRIMESPGGNPSDPLPSFNNVVPYEDLASDSKQLDVFCRAVDGLLPQMIKLRGDRLTGAEWAGAIRMLMDTFLDIPETQGEEVLVHLALLKALELLPTLDAASMNARLSMPLIREFLMTHLKEINVPPSGSRSGGVTIGPLQAARPLPYKVVYILGLGEGMYPAPDVISPFDLRDRQPLPFDMHPSDVHRQQYLEIAGAAREKIYLLYSCRNIQKDQDLFASSLINTFTAFISEHVLPLADNQAAPFQICKAPLNSHDQKFIRNDAPARHSDAIVTYQRTHRLLALQEAHASGAVSKRAAQVKELIEHSPRALLTDKQHCKPDNPKSAKTVEHVPIRTLANFLNDPGRQALKRHLHVESEDIPDCSNDEPQFTPKYTTRNLVQSSLQQLAMRAARGEDPPLTECVDTAVAAYTRRELEGVAPAGAFARHELSEIRSEVRRRAVGLDSVGGLTRNRRRADFVGPVQIGASMVPSHARTPFPPLRLTLGSASAPIFAELSGGMDLVWRTQTEIEIVQILHGCSASSVKNRVCYNAFEPVLFFLALLSGEESRAWVGERTLKLTLAVDDGLQDHQWQVAPDQAQRYLRMLTSEFLSAGEFHDLPFSTIASDKKLSAAYLSNDDAALTALRATFVDDLREKFEAKFEKRDDNRLKISELVDLDVPDDAFAIMRRRFYLFEHGNLPTDLIEGE